ncbi:hypothetical protein DFJ77DRAFT_356809 [Powellomyces hirtus]|nr:hypothetical protein DFJ77DRAFT_356809 [Powellomyces hirtus]
MPIRLRLGSMPQHYESWPHVLLVLLCAHVAFVHAAFADWTWSRDAPSDGSYFSGDPDWVGSIRLSSNAPITGPTMTANTCSFRKLLDGRRRVRYGLLLYEHAATPLLRHNFEQLRNILHRAWLVLRGACQASHHLLARLGHLSIIQCVTEHRVHGLRHNSKSKPVGKVIDWYLNDAGYYSDNALMTTWGNSESTYRRGVRIHIYAAREPTTITSTTSLTTTKTATATLPLTTVTATVTSTSTAVSTSFLMTTKTATASLPPTTVTSTAISTSTATATLPALTETATVISTSTAVSTTTKTATAILPPTTVTVTVISTSTVTATLPAFTETATVISTSTAVSTSFLTTTKTATLPAITETATVVSISTAQQVTITETTSLTKTSTQLFVTTKSNPVTVTAGATITATTTKGVYIYAMKGGWGKDLTTTDLGLSLPTFLNHIPAL